MLLSSIHTRFQPHTLLCLPVQEAASAAAQLQDVCAAAAERLAACEARSAELSAHLEEAKARGGGSEPRPPVMPGPGACGSLQGFMESAICPALVTQQRKGLSEVFDELPDQ